uniref:Uncharacterized protein n=1 Tax=Anguilla anguilla TaxID=7936 RepID=A0A0E9WDM8_ANGAN
MSRTLFCNRQKVVRQNKVMNAMRSHPEVHFQSTKKISWPTCPACRAV